MGVGSTAAPMQEWHHTVALSEECTRWGRLAPTSGADLVFLLYPRQDSNLRFRLRRAALYPLSYGGSAGFRSSAGWPWCGDDPTVAVSHDENPSRQVRRCATHTRTAITIRAGGARADRLGR